MPDCDSGLPSEKSAEICLIHTERLCHPEKLDFLVQVVVDIVDCGCRSARKSVNFLELLHAAGEIEYSLAVQHGDCVLVPGAVYLSDVDVAQGVCRFRRKTSLNAEPGYHRDRYHKMILEVPQWIFREFSELFVAQGKHQAFHKVKVALLHSIIERKLLVVFQVID